MQEYNNKDLVIPDLSNMKEEDAYSDYHPFNSVYMRYDKRRHMYFLTPAAMSNFRLDNGIQTHELAEFIDQVSRAVYSYIAVKAGRTNNPKMMYRIAKGYGAPTLSRNDFRHIFLFDVLKVQAVHMASGYAKDAPKIVVNDAGRIKANDMSEQDGYWLHDDVITKLDALNLTNPQAIHDHWGIKWDEY